MRKKTELLSRRAFVSAVGAAALAAPSVLSAQATEGVVRNVGSFRPHQWQDHFEKIGKGIILSDTNARFLQHWTADGEMRLYPTSVPLSEDLTRRGYTEVIDKKVAPGWGPTPAMRIRNPEWPAYIPGGDPLNPLGSHALYLSWQYYRIHGTQDTRKIGRRSSNGCIGLYNAQIAEVFGRTPIGTQVKLI
ncbi:L,D-transpeptidase [Yoonia sp.]|uniref:L,D-transpeptidase n=1 Tax=Yoonia sp. TaxID=2212373 RepID=UPI0023B4DE99